MTVPFENDHRHPRRSKALPAATLQWSGPLGKPAVQITAIERIEATGAHCLGNHVRIYGVGPQRSGFKLVIRATRFDLIKANQRANRAVKTGSCPRFPDNQSRTSALSRLHRAISAASSFAK